MYIESAKRHKPLYCELDCSSWVSLKEVLDYRLDDASWVVLGKVLCHPVACEAFDSATAANSYKEIEQYIEEYTKEQRERLEFMESQFRDIDSLLGSLYYGYSVKGQVEDLSLSWEERKFDPYLWGTVLGMSLKSSDFQLNNYGRDILKRVTEVRSISK